MKYDSAYFDNCLSEMKEMFNLTDEMFLELNDGFFDIITQQIEILRLALLQKDFDQLLLHSHTLKGSSASLRHHNITLIATEIEHHAKEKTPFDYGIVIYTLSEDIAQLRTGYHYWKRHYHSSST
jgi:HPt (histidine-containing phosphotransfer) domain-containing protein